MASVAGGPPSLLNRFVQNCWVVGTQRITSQRGEEQFVEVRTELSDHTIFYLHRTDADVGRLIERLVDSFPEEKDALSKSLLDGLSRIKEAEEANDTEGRLIETEKVLRNVINTPWKYSRSEAVLTFFEQSPLDQTLGENEFNDMEPHYQSPVTISDIMRSNGFCLANTETIVYDLNPPKDGGRCQSADSARLGDCNQIDLETEVDLKTSSAECGDLNLDFSNLMYYQLVSYETDILE